MEIITLATGRVYTVLLGGQSWHGGIADGPRRTRGAQIVPIRASFARAQTCDDLDPLDLAQRHLQEAGAELAEGVGVAGAEEAVVALAVAARGRGRRAPACAGRRRRPRGRR